MKKDWDNAREEMRVATETGDFARRREIVREIQFANWIALTRHCGRCGAEMRPHTDLSRICTRCGNEVFPQLSPAIVVLVKRGDEALLVHNRSWQNDRHALVAGFIEPGENAEECVRREVREETSVEIDNIRYVGSESWPFPGQLMLGFTADYVSGEVRFADEELDRGGFFSRTQTPPVPDKASLSGRIIADWKIGKL